MKEILINEFDYNLPEYKIAKHPLEKRSASKLLIYTSGKISESKSEAIASFLPAGGLIVFNDTKVIQARLIFHKDTGAKIEVFCLSPNSPADFESSFSAKNKCSWYCIVGNARKWKTGKIKLTTAIEGQQETIFAEQISRNKDNFTIEFSWENSTLNFAQILDNVGVTPIPPYLNRKSENADKDRYQTVYSAHKGSVAAPTAGLHFTNATIEDIKNKSIKTDFVTLHVGAGTFKPVKSESIGEHQMHAEFFSITTDTLKNIKANIGSITAVGTTSVRTLESLYWLGVKLINKASIEALAQWEIYNLPTDISINTALDALIKHAQANENKFSAHTKIMIAPGYKFKIVSRIITNFHQPKSTLLLLISAFVGENWKAIYQYALNNNFRFLSYGDSSLLEKQKP